VVYIWEFGGGGDGGGDGGGVCGECFKRVLGVKVSERVLRIEQTPQQCFFPLRVRFPMLLRNSQSFRFSLCVS
jgi:hypothetical protein